MTHHTIKTRKAVPIRSEHINHSNDQSNHRVKLANHEKSQKHNGQGKSGVKQHICAVLRPRFVYFARAPKTFSKVFTALRHKPDEQRRKNTALGSNFLEFPS